MRELSHEPSAFTPWGADARNSCIYESIPPAILNTHPTLRASHDAYKHQRTSFPLSPQVYDILFASHLTTLITALLGPTAVLFNDQYIVKPGGMARAESTSFSWHRDSDWIDKDLVQPSPYVSVWVALDDMCLSNGCFMVKPYSHIHTTNTGLQTETEAKGGEIAVEIGAGSAIITTDQTEHGSGPNTTNFARRAWMPQFSSHPIVSKQTGQPVSLAIPLCPNNV